MENQKFLPDKIKNLIHGKPTKSGRNNTGQITVWHKGNRHPRLYRKIDFKRHSTNGIVVGLEYDPNRGAFLARIFNPDTRVNNYILAPDKIKIGNVIRSDSEHTINGHSQKIRYIPTGSSIFNISTKPGGIGKFIRAPGNFGTLIKKTNTEAQLVLNSGQKKWFNINTLATIGIVSHPNKKLRKLKKAGQSRWLGRKPVVRGVAMNPVDHPHGGGEGKTSGGRPSVTPWGNPTRGKRTVN
ncbi:unnamed protein product [Dictyota dichotoma]|uniref:Ribosomal protein L2 n=1 Tax=Dictyota dichotoma TaxID=2876 RepID=Q2TUB6_DICDH|nr:ribosomal protein L2 [Dictyota dichotoma]AAS79079.1 ribosomal protein L2 [Dictyota dichotoma]